MKYIDFIFNINESYNSKKHDYVIKNMSVIYPVTLDKEEFISKSLSFDKEVYLHLNIIDEDMDISDYNNFNSINISGSNESILTILDNNILIRFSYNEYHPINDNIKILISMISDKLHNVYIDYSSYNNINPSENISYDILKSIKIRLVYLWNQKIIKWNHVIDYDS